MGIDLRTKTLEEVEVLYQRALISFEETRDYVRKWNAGPHLTQAVIFDGRIRNFDPETNRAYKHLYAEFAVSS